MVRTEEEIRMKVAYATSRAKEAKKKGDLDSQIAWLSIESEMEWVLGEQEDTQIYQEWLAKV